MSWRILYRGCLDSCNYDCTYCPFAKYSASKQQLQQDEQQLNRFVNWVEAQTVPIRVLFTPWGEALIWSYYQQALIRLAQCDNVQTVCIQTNLSGKLDWLRRCDTNKLYLWASYHPDQVTLTGFKQQCELALRLGAKLSVGSVGLKQHLSAIQALKQVLPARTSFWINAYKETPAYYSKQEIQDFCQIDPFFKLNLASHDSFDQPCATGESVFTVDGDGNIRRCHFIHDILGNIYQPNIASVLTRRNCTASSCDCYIGYIHLRALGFPERYGETYFERYRLCP